MWRVKRCIHIPCPPLDHTGLLPTIVDSVDKFIMTYENKELLQPLLLDGAYIIQRNSKALENQKYKITSLYTEQDVYRMLNKTEVYTKEEIHVLNEYVSFRFLPNNHIVGATSIELFFKMPSGTIKKIFYSGDVGSPNNQQPFCEKTKGVSKANMIITEATYSDLSRCYSPSDVKKERQQMVKDIKEEIKRGHSILFPAFAMSRTQNLLYFLYKEFYEDENFNIPIYLDGKLSHEMNSVYRRIIKNEEERKLFDKILTWKNLHFVNSYEDSLIVAHQKDIQKIVISSAGMCNVGRIQNHLMANVENKKYTIMFIGYCAESTIGGQLLKDNVKEVKIEGVTYKKQAKIIKYKTWSSHIQGNELINLLKGVNTNIIVLHHSDDSKYEFRDVIEKELRLCNNSTKVVCTDKDNNIFFI